jgi:hypothetical protein
MELGYISDEELLLEAIRDCRARYREGNDGASPRFVFVSTRFLCSLTMEKRHAMGDVLELDESLTGFTCYTRNIKQKMEEK